VLKMLDVQAVARSMDSPEIHALIKDLKIPPRPSSLVDMQEELKREDPRMHLLVQIVSSDVALAASMMKVANSPWAGLSRPAETIQQAFMLLGLVRSESVLTEIALRKVLPTDGPALYRFWDTSSRRSHAMAALGPRVGLSASMAQTFGLFADVGIPLMAQQFCAPPYIETLNAAQRTEGAFTDVEHDRHQTNHALVGAVLARSWGVSQTVALAVRLHHDYAVFGAANAPQEVQRLIALCLIVEYVILRYQGLQASAEWAKGGEQAQAWLGLSGEQIEDWCDEMHERFGREH
jgi:HD-like signal output (HDOD) protein